MLPQALLAIASLFTGSRAHIEELPVVHLDPTELHQLVFENDTSKTNVSFGMAMYRLGTHEDLYYAMLGNPSNDEENLSQLKSYQRVHSTIANSLHRTVHACSFNKDLPQPDEPEVGDTYFGDLEHMKDSHMMEVVKADKLEFNRPLDEEHLNLDFIGLNLYAWYDCMPYHGDHVCIRVIQVRNTKGYYPKQISINETQPAFSWIQRKINQLPKSNPLILLFQNFNSEVLGISRRIEKMLVDDLGFSINLLGIFFSIQNRPIYLRKKLCLKDIEKNSFDIPIINFGALKKGEYLMMQFNPRHYGARNMFQMDVRTQRVNPTVLGKVTVARPHPFKSWECLDRERNVEL